MRTEEERQALCFEWETDGKDGQPVKQLPTEVQLKLKRGQAAVVHTRPLAHDASLARLRSHTDGAVCVSVGREPDPPRPQAPGAPGADVAHRQHRARRPGHPARVVSRTVVAGIWVAFFQECQQ